MAVQGWLKIEGWPTCARCAKPVDRIETSYCWVKGATVVRVHCHGAHEDVLIADRLILESRDMAKISIDGRAFERGSVQCLTTSQE